MSGLENVIQNNVLASLTRGAPQGVLNAIKQASVRTGVNFAYLVKQAAAESSFKPDIKAKTSSATGLYQFIESTWLSIVDKYGDKHGLSTEGKSRTEILEMRKDPQTASLMAAEFAGENERFLKSHTKADIGETELYFAHFLGAPKAASFLNGLAETPLQEAALLFPKEAAANRNVFYDSKTGRARTMQEVYNLFDKKFGDTSGNESLTVASTEKEIPAQRASLYASSDYRRSAFGTGRDLALEIIGRPAQNDYNRIPFQRMMANPVELMLLTQLDNPLQENNDKTSLF
ncbi:MAG TPA: flagellar biosynthesis protein FlgJ [Rhodospirillaceae bacterium]|nr:flagellar biosynthesis protein FlgJ [Rhodospirillaceae bacterium]